MKIHLQSYFIAVLVGYLMSQNSVLAEDKNTDKSAVAVFAGGCFWCMEPPFDVLPGVIKTTSGYTGGNVDNPSYEEISNGKTGHYEAIEVTYDPKIITYEKLLEVFWHNIDPFDKEGQFCDKGTQYQAVIFYQDDSQKQLAESSKQMIAKNVDGKELATSIKPAGKFYPAEDYHQDYYLKNPYRYKFYRYTCGRDRRLKQIWG